ncbi:MAG: hypothetical protein IPJ61_19095 [Tessaracoccus sp.]|nr:hypothetical protein [Tessaracoccus sp.]MBK7823094.1 hypothetical protein [Tessaracoccus sp.]
MDHPWVGQFAALHTPSSKIHARGVGIGIDAGADGATLCARIAAPT